MYTTVRRDLIGQLVAKVILGNFTTFFIFTSVMYWPMTVAASARLIGPMITVVLSSIFLREFATKLQLLFLALTLGGAIMVIQSSPISAVE